MQEERIGEYFAQVSRGRYTHLLLRRAILILYVSDRSYLDASGVSTLLDKMSNAVTPKSRQVITKCLADLDRVTLAQFIDIWRSA
jgi:hypothetical protein